MVILITAGYLYLFGMIVVLCAELLQDGGFTWDEFIGILFYPIAVPFFLWLHRWQWGTKQHRRYRYGDMKWYNRGEKVSRNE